MASAWRSSMPAACNRLTAACVSSTRLFYELQLCRRDELAWYKSAVQEKAHVGAWALVVKAAGCSRHPNRCENNRILAHRTCTSRSCSRPANYSPAACETRITIPSSASALRTAWEHPLVEWARTATSYCSLVLDCDSRESQELACAVEAGYGDLPRPNVASQRSTSGHLHLGWNLRTPVHRGAASRPRPLAALGHIAEYYAVTLRSDRGYVGVLAYNPVHGDYNTVYPRTDPYDLAELARALPAHWRRPARAADLVSAPGRNCHLFAALCKLATRGSDEGLLTWARTLNREFAVPLSESEVRGIWRSVCRYRARWRAQGHQQAWLWKQAARARKGGLIGGRKAGVVSGVMRRAGSLTERQPWADLGVSRRTWYRRFRGAKTDGESRWAKVGTEANTDRSGSGHLLLKA